MPSRCIKADPFGPDYKWHIILHQSDMNDPKTLYKKMNHENARTIKDIFISGNLHLYFNQLVEKYLNDVVQHDGGQALILVEKSGVVFNQNIGGYIYIVSDTIKLPMSKNCNLQALNDTKIIWQSEKKRMRSIQTGLNDQELKVIARDFFDKVSKYAGPNMPTAVMILGYCGLNFMRRFLDNEYQLGICCLVGQGETGKTTICDFIAELFPLRQNKDGTYGLEKENELSLGKFAESVQSNRCPLLVDQPTSELKPILDNAYENSLRETLRSKTDIEINTLCILNWGDDYQDLESFTFSQVTKTLWTKNIKSTDEEFLGEDELLELKTEIKSKKLQYSALFKLLVKESDMTKLLSDIKKYNKMIRDDPRNSFEKVPARINEIYAQAIAGKTQF